ncbi:MAG: SDR family NAD(P)-dependent oxidoreductase [Pseudomonadota bacterium]
MIHENRKWTVVTGSTGGIGSEVVNILARMKKDLILVNRSSAEGPRQRDNLLRNFPGLSVEAVTANLMDTRSVFNAIDVINALPGPIDALYNVAGVLNAKKIFSEQGIESNFAVNTLAPYQFVQGLRTKMARSSEDSAAVIMNFSSSAISKQKSLDIDNLVDPPEVTGLMGTYAQAKLALTVLTAALAGDLKTDNILIRAVDPGATKTTMTTQNSSMPKLLQWFAPLFFADADKQATKVVRSADPSAFEGMTGIFVSNLKQKKLPGPAADQSNWRKLLVLLDHSLSVGEREN